MQSVQRSFNLLFQCTFVLVFPLFKKYLNTQVTTNKFVTSVAYHPCNWTLSLRDTSFPISLIWLGFYLFPECLLNFLWLVYSIMCRKMFSIYSVHIPKKWTESLHFYPCLSLLLKTPGIVFWKSVSFKTKGVEKNMICFIKVQSEKKKTTWNVCLFCMICNIFKCDSLIVLWIISIKQCGIKFIASSSL